MSEIRSGLLGVVLYPLAQAPAVRPRADCGEGATRMSQCFPQMLQPLLKAVDSENVNYTDEVAPIRPVDDVQRILQVGKQTSILGLEVWKVCGLTSWPDML